jgi:hypothetical protein
VSVVCVCVCVCLRAWAWVLVGEQARAHAHTHTYTHTHTHTYTHTIQVLRVETFGVTINWTGPRADASCPIVNYCVLIDGKEVARLPATATHVRACVNVCVCVCVVCVCVCVGGWLSGCMCLCACLFVFMYACVCSCMRDRERERERESVCVCVGGWACTFCSALTRIILFCVQYRTTLSVRQRKHVLQMRTIAQDSLVSSDFSPAFDIFTDA